MSYMQPIKLSDASMLINQYSTAIANLKTDPNTKNAPWVNSAIAEYQNYISQLEKNSIPDEEFRKRFADNGNSNKLNIIAWF